MVNRGHTTLAPISASEIALRGGLRIAIPSWRSVGLPLCPEPPSEATLSREEIQYLFQGDFKANAKRKSTLTRREEQEKSLALRLRRALYPDASRAWSH